MFDFIKLKVKQEGGSYKIWKIVVADLFVIVVADLFVNYLSSEKEHHTEIISNTAVEVNNINPPSFEFNICKISEQSKECAPLPDRSFVQADDAYQIHLTNSGNAHCYVFQIGSDQKQISVFFL